VKKNLRTNTHVVLENGEVVRFDKGDLFEDIDEEYRSQIRSDIWQEDRPAPVDKPSQAKSLSVVELKELADALDIEGFESMNKAQLTKAIENATN
jgi:hypothetical protein